MVSAEEKISAGHFSLDFNVCGHSPRLKSPTDAHVISVGARLKCNIQHTIQTPIFVLNEWILFTFLRNKTKIE